MSVLHRLPVDVLLLVCDYVQVWFEETEDEDNYCRYPFHRRTRTGNF